MSCWRAWSHWPCDRIPIKKQRDIARRECVTCVLWSHNGPHIVTSSNADILFPLMLTTINYSLAAHHTHYPRVDRTWLLELKQKKLFLIMLPRLSPDQDSQPIPLRFLDITQNFECEHINKFPSSEVKHDFWFGFHRLHLWSGKPSWSISRDFSIW